MEDYFKKYISTKDEMKNLSSIFFRYKPLWLALKKESSYMSKTINKMRKLAKKYHKPVKPKILDTITSSKNINKNEFKCELSKVTIFKKIALVNSILFRKAAPKSIAYFIRNAKAFATTYDKNFEMNCEVFDILMNSIIDHMRPKVEGKTIYIPKNFTYTMPTSEKLFWGAIPYGSSYNLSNKNIVLGVHWNNVKNKNNIEERVDLDLHFQSKKYDVGWNNYIDDDNVDNAKSEAIIFSGDMTDAPINKGGATEAFFVGANVIDDMSIINLNNYTNNGIPVPFKFIIDNVSSDRVNRKYLINSHTMSFCVPNEISGAEIFLGFLNSDLQGNKKFYFTSASLGNRIIAKYDINANHMTEALQTSFESSLKLKDVLKMAGAIFEKSDNKDWDINLDPQILVKDTILNFLC